MTRSTPPPHQPTFLEVERAHIQRRTLWVVVASQALGGAGLSAGVAVGALLAEEMLDSQDLAGVPAGLFTLGAAAAAYLIGLVSQRRGRRLGLGSGFIVGGLGALGIVVAAATDSIPLLMGSLLIYGAGSAANLQARYAGTDLAAPTSRGTAISIALVATTVGAVAGPNLIEPLGLLAGTLGLPTLAGPFLLAAAAYLAAGCALLIFLRPDPLLVARKLAVSSPPPVLKPRGTLNGSSGVYAGATVMILAQVVMVAIMTMTPIHMLAHHHSLADVGLVISVHIAAMYLPSLVTGALIDRLGRFPVAIGGGVTLLIAGLTAAFAPGDSLPMTLVALFLLGAGWNLGFIAGTTLIADGSSPSRRAQVEGLLDVFVALAGAGAAVTSGMLAATTGFVILALIAGLISLLAIPVTICASKRQLPRRDAQPVRDH